MKRLTIIFFFFIIGYALYWCISDYVIISAIWYRRSGRMVPPVSRCRIFHSGDVVPHQISFFDILVHQRV